MAVTSIWAVTHHIDNTITYIVNPEKTIERPELSQEAINARKAVGDVIDYASNGDKTDQMMYVTPITDIRLSKRVMARSLQKLHIRLESNLLKSYGATDLKSLLPLTLIRVICTIIL